MKKNNQITEVNTGIQNFSPESLISQAIDKNVSVESLERLLDMRRQLKAEWAKEQFDKAMANFQSEVPTIEKKKQGYNYKYADLTDIVEQTRDYLSKNGFSYSFDTDETEKGLIIYCIIKHVDGHSEKSKAFIDKETTTKMNSSQQSGSVMTYGKRYAFVNALGILTGDEDTDAATPRNEIKTQNRPTVVPQKQVNYGEPDNMPPAVQNEEAPADAVSKSRVVALIKAGKVKKEFAEVNKMTMVEAQQILSAN